MPSVCVCLDFFLHCFEELCLVILFHRLVEVHRVFVSETRRVREWIHLVPSRSYLLCVHLSHDARFVRCECQFRSQSSVLLFRCGGSLWLYLIVSLPLFLVGLSGLLELSMSLPLFSSGMRGILGLCLALPLFSGPWGSCGLPGLSVALPLFAGPRCVSGLPGLCMTLPMELPGLFLTLLPHGVSGLPGLFVTLPSGLPGLFITLPSPLLALG